MWGTQKILVFKNAKSDNNMININTVINFEQSGDFIQFMTARPNPTRIVFDNEEDCKKVYDYLKSNYCYEVSLTSINDDLPF